MQLHSTDGPVAEGRPTRLEIEPPPAPDLEAARAAVARFTGWKIHPFPGCFVCGTERAEADGLRIFTGLLADRSGVAAPWVPDPSLADTDGNVRAEFVWAALDCPGAFAYPPSDVGFYLLGEIAAELARSRARRRNLHGARLAAGRGGPKAVRGDGALRLAGCVRGPGSRNLDRGSQTAMRNVAQ